MQGIAMPWITCLIQRMELEVNFPSGRFKIQKKDFFIYGKIQLKNSYLQTFLHERKV